MERREERVKMHGERESQHQTGPRSKDAEKRSDNIERWQKRRGDKNEVPKDNMEIYDLFFSVHVENYIHARINNKISFIKAFVSVTCLQLHTIRHILDTSLGYWCLPTLYINIFRGGSSQDEICLNSLSLGREMLRT